MAKTHWHYPRPDFAERTLALLADGPLQGLRMFGPRRTGKTEFLTQDLAPLAEAEGHRVVYANFWQAIDSPAAILLYEMDFALRHGSIADRLRHTAAELAPKFRVRNPVGEGEIEIDLARLKGKTPDNLLLLLDQYCDQLADDKKPTMLLLDEFQELARGGPKSKPLIAGLRTSLEKRRHGLAALFTGSSQERLQAMFSPTQAPFYRFALQHDLPPLDEAFVAHQLKAYKQTFKAGLDAREAEAVFEQNGRNPLLLQRWLMVRGTHANLNAAAAVERANADLAAEFGFADKWRQLTPIQRAVARALAERISPLFGDAGANRIAALLQEPAPAPQRTQAALRRLARLGLVDKWDKDWRLGDPLFEAWVRARPESEF